MGVPRGFLIAGIRFDPAFDFLESLLLKTPASSWKEAWNNFKCIQVDVSPGYASCPDKFLLKDIKLKAIVDYFEGGTDDTAAENTLVRQHDVQKIKCCTPLRGHRAVKGSRHKLRIPIR